MIMPEDREVLQTGEPSLRRALGAVAGTAVDQAHDLVVAQLDHWTEQVHKRLEAPVEEAAADQSNLAKPLIVGALAGVAVAWLLSGRRPES